MIGRPDMGACSGIPDMGAWHFSGPDGLRTGLLSNNPTLTSDIESTSALTGKLGDDIAVDGQFGSEI